MCSSCYGEPCAQDWPTYLELNPTNMKAVLNHVDKIYVRKDFQEVDLRNDVKFLAQLKERHIKLLERMQQLREEILALNRQIFELDGLNGENETPLIEL